MKIRIFAVTFLAALVAASLTSLGRTPQAKVTCRVLDESGNVVTGAVVNFSTFKKAAWDAGSLKTEFTDVAGATDTNGFVTLSILCIQGEVSCSVYRGNQGIQNGIRMAVAGTDYYLDYGKKVYFTNHVAGRWQPWNPTIELPLRRILNPSAMHAKKTNIRIPVFNESLGYDLEKGDWISPHGTGLTADFIFQVRCVWNGDESPYGEKYYDASVELTFSNEDDGIIEFADSQPALEGSIFRLSRFAPDNGYTNKWSLRQLMNSEGSHYDTASQREGLNYFLRVRTKKDEAGNIIAANYGKIRKPLQLIVTPGNTWIGMTYYFNPTPNDRNMEFDPSRNLFTDLPVTSQVRDP